jgi:hypothetical protein
MNRTTLAKHIRARLEPLAEDLADLLWSSVETQIAEVLDVARSALLSEIVPEVGAVPVALVTNEAVGSANPAAETPQEPSNGRSDAGHEPLNPGAGARIVKLARTHRVITAKELPEVIEAIGTEPPVPVRAPHNKGKQIVCTVCKEPGHNARRHKTETWASEATAARDEDMDAAPAPVPFVSRRDRFAAIEQSAAKRNGTLPVPRTTVDLRGGG